MDRSNRTRQEPFSDAEIASGVRITPEADGFRLLSSGKIQNGDLLLVSYTTQSGWQRIEVEYQHEPKGMFIFTGDRPTNVMVIAKESLFQAERSHDVPVGVYRNDRNRYDSSTTPDTYSLNDLFDPTNVFSPYHSLNPLDPLGFLNLFGGSHHHHDNLPTTDDSRAPTDTNMFGGFDAEQSGGTSVGDHHRDAFGPDISGGTGLDQMKDGDFGNDFSGGTGLGGRGEGYGEFSGPDNQNDHTDGFGDKEGGFGEDKDEGGFGEDKDEGFGGGDGDDKGFGADDQDGGLGGSDNDPSAY
jgi:hypothetical protein